MKHADFNWEFVWGDLESLGRAVILAGKTVTESVALADGSLHLTFSDQSEITVPPHDYYEAWTVEGPGKFLAVCAPGGKLVVWDEE